MEAGRTPWRLASAPISALALASPSRAALAASWPSNTRLPCWSPPPACLQYAGLTETVNGLSGVTILAPTNDAFVDLLDALNATALTDITPQDVASVSGTCLFVFTVCFSAWIMLTQTQQRGLLM